MASPKIYQVTNLQTQLTSVSDAANNRVLKAGDTMTGSLSIDSGSITANVNDGQRAAYFKSATRTLAIYPYYNSEGSDRGSWLATYNTSGGSYNKFTITAKDVSFDIQGNVGISTLNPTSNLHVIGTANVSGNTILAGNAVYVVKTTGGVGTNRVGINTSTPNVTLDIRYANEQPRMFIGYTAPTAQSLLDSRVELDGLDGKHLKLVGSYTGFSTFSYAGNRNAYINYYGVSPEESATVMYLDIAAIPEEPGGLGGDGSKIRFLTNTGTSNSATVRMTIDANGAVGIGSEYPDTVGYGVKLFVNGGIYSSTGYRFPDGTTQTSAATGAPSLNIVSGTAVTAIKDNHYIITNGSATTVTLPASPANGDIVWVTVASNTTNNIIARNGKLLQGLAEDMNLNSIYASAQLRFINNTYGWRMV